MEGGSSVDETKIIKNMDNTKINFTGVRVESAKADDTPTTCANTAHSAPVGKCDKGPGMARTVPKTKRQSRRKGPGKAGTDSTNRARVIGTGKTSTDPSTPVTVPSAAHPLGGPHITQHTEQIAPHAGTSGPSASVNADTVTRTEDYFSSAWQVQKRKGKGKQTPQPQRPNQNQHGVSSKKRKINPRQRRRARMNANAAPDTPALPAAPTSGQPCFCAGGRTQAQAGESRPGPSGRPPGAGAGRPVKEGDETISPAGEVQTAAKRALNETLSPRGKRKRQCLDPSKRATPRVSYAQATKESLCIAVTCGHTGILTKDVADTILTGIQKTILKEAWSPNNKQPGPAFNGKPVYTEGVLKLWCSNDHTLTWLQKTIADLALSTGHQLIIKSQSEITRRIRCGILIPNEQGAITDSRDIGRILAYQNPQIAVDRWVLQRQEKQQGASFVVVGIPEEQIATLMKSGRRLAFGLGAVYVKFQGHNGKFADTPPGWDPATFTIQKQPGTSTTTSEGAGPTEGPAVPVPATVPSQDDDPEEALLTGSDLEGDEVESGDLLAGLQLGGDEEGAICDGVPFFVDN
ncbi:uncharacterized protein LOC124645366 [Helicoverpa zea]|uniref:uncharacterized protein LOC124642951 n=1 Tax=Helicoverpa zea TaxID=7113 RepID=UPI001F563347|nr:uncharacterized protein LOC124642951 [Helicoverpa zea]XP_047041125.1 uncharacterized protein LOC124645366 [Helicoverpa zea]